MWLGLSPVQCEWVCGDPLCMGARRRSCVSRECSGRRRFHDFVVDAPGVAESEVFGRMATVRPTPLRVTVHMSTARSTLLLGGVRPRSHGKRIKSNDVVRGWRSGRRRGSPREEGSIWEVNASSVRGERERRRRLLLGERHGALLTS